MSSGKQVVSAGMVGLILAVALIAGAALFLASPTTIGTPSQTSSSTQVNSSTQSVGGQGTLDVLLTDPPNVPAGVTAVYVTYNNVAVHVRDAGNQSGWTNSNTAGTIDLMKLINYSTTIASIKVTTGVYNALRFNISSAAVTFNGKNYTAFVPRAMLTVLIPGGISVNAKNSSAEIIDMSPTVLNIGSESTPEFIISTAASCFRVPSSILLVTKNIDHRGFILGLAGATWWHQIREGYTANVTISEASLSASSLSVTLENTGSTPLNLSAVIVTSLGYECALQTSTSSTTTSTAHSGNHVRIPDCFTRSATFLIDNGTLLSLRDRPVSLAQVLFSPWSLFGKMGLTVAPGDSATLTYSGPINFVISGDKYSITVVGLQALAQTDVAAS